jgi:hypothetical protein
VLQAALGSPFPLKAGGWIMKKLSLSLDELRVEFV